MYDMIDWVLKEMVFMEYICIAFFGLGVGFNIFMIMSAMFNVKDMREDHLLCHSYAPKLHQPHL